MLSALLVALVVACVAAIFYLAQQSVRKTGDVALAAERWLLARVKPTGTGSIGEPTWWGLTIRKLAHLAEYVALGALAAAATSAVMAQATPVSWLVATAITCALSVADELHKCFVPGRHFDAFDLLLDVAGYLPATIVVTLFATLFV